MLTDHAFEEFHAS